MNAFSSGLVYIYIYTTLSIFLRSLLVLCTGKQNTLRKLFKQMCRIITVCYRQEMRPNMGTFVFDEKYNCIFSYTKW